MHATRSWAVEPATCLAAETRRSSEPKPCTKALALSANECAAAAVNLAAETNPSDHCPSSDECNGRLATLPYE